MILKIDQIQKSFFKGQNELEILKDLSFEMKDGESSVSIVGKSGSGKTTLLSLIAGILSPDQGNILYSGKSKNDFKKGDWEKFRSSYLSIIFQQFHLIDSLNALENVMLPLSIKKQDNAKEKALNWLEKVGLADRAFHYPYQLSGGECQRVAMARAFVVDSKIILADEPSGNLDEGTGSKIMEELFSLVKKENRHLILVTHDSELAQMCEKKYLLESKKLHLQ